ncbi:MAG: Ig-like domain-containing protein [Lachnospiraceae bacterium]|nr:Ig-like domain-containing protein [Lachnospiraceae bacterium]
MKLWRTAAAVIAITLCITAVPVAAEKSQDEKTVSISEEWEGADKGLGYIPYQNEVYNENDLIDIQTATSPGEKRRSAVVLPSSYDARDDGVVPSVKDQGNTGSCWAFAALGSGESGLMKKGIEKGLGAEIEEPDLSERQLTYTALNYWLDPLNLTEGDIKQLGSGVNSYNQGGNSTIAINSLAAWRGAVDEEKAPYDVIYNADVDEKDKDIRIPDSLVYQQDSYHLENSESVYLATPNRIKELLMEKGCAEISYHAPDTKAEVSRYANADYTAYYVDDENAGINHAVLLVGWDDDYPVENFNPNCRPEKPGAWLIRNSWGTDIHDEGYLWISYEDKVLSQEANEVTFFDMVPADNYDNNYQYDGSAAYAYVIGPQGMANIFTAQYKENLEAVSIQTLERNVTYEIKIYQVSDATKPESGKQLGTTITGTVEERGYHTIDFTEQGGEDIALDKGNKFSVVVRLKNEEDDDSYIVMEYAYPSRFGVTEKVSLKEKESFVLNGSRWQDCADNPKVFMGNLRIKAFTTVDDSVPCTGITAKTDRITVPLNEKADISYTLSPNNVTNEVVTWESADESIVRVSNGVVYGIKKGETTVTGRINGHEMTVPVTVVDAPVVKPGTPTSDATNTPTPAVTKKPTPLPTPKPPTVKKEVKKVVITKKGKKKALKKKVTLKEGEKLKLAAKVTVTGGASKKVTWKSSKKKVATVSGKGVVKAKKKGKAKITVTSKVNKKKKCTITIRVK